MQANVSFSAGCVVAGSDERVHYRLGTRSDKGPVDTVRWWGCASTMWEIYREMYLISLYLVQSWESDAGVS